jgi:hypothetical protein
VKKKPTKSKSGDVMRKVRKPVPPPSRVEEDLKRYHRERERERLRREQAEAEENKKKS